MGCLPSVTKALFFRSSSILAGASSSSSRHTKKRPCWPFTDDGVGFAKVSDRFSSLQTPKCMSRYFGLLFCRPCTMCTQPYRLFLPFRIIIVVIIIIGAAPYPALPNPEWRRRRTVRPSLRPSLQSDRRTRRAPLPFPSIPSPWYDVHKHWRRREVWDVLLFVLSSKRRRRREAERREGPV